MTNFVDRAFTPAEQERAVDELPQALMCVMNGCSRNSPAQPWTYDFYSSLRCDFVPLTLLKKSIIALEVHVAQQVHARIGKHPLVSVAVDGWEDHHKLPTLAFTVRLPDCSCYLYKFEQIHNPESGNFLEAKINSMVEDIESKLKVKVVGVVADNAKNIQKGIRQASETRSFFQLNCCAHTLQLLLQDLSSLFDGQFEQLKQVEVFFRSAAWPWKPYWVGWNRTHLLVLVAGLGLGQAASVLALMLAAAGVPAAVPSCLRGKSSAEA